MEQSEIIGKGCFSLPKNSQNRFNLKTAVVILNWNGKAYLEKFLPGVVANSVPAEVIVADNGSTDDSVAFLEKNFPGVRIIRFRENSGFAKGYNDALKQVDADYFVLLNSDVEVTENWIVPVIGMMEADKTIAAAQPKIKSYNDKTRFEYAGAAGGFIDRFGYPFCRGRIFDFVEADNGQYDTPGEIFWATGACLFVRADVYKSAGGLDSDFFAHMEEIDLCWRMKNQGYRIFYCPGSTVYHIGGGTLHKSNPRKTFLNFRNNLWLLLKNLPAGKLIMVLPVRFVLDGLAGLKFLFEGNYKDCFAVVKAHFYIYFSLFSTLKKRSRVLHPDSTGIFNQSIVLGFYVGGKKKFSDLR